MNIIYEYECDLFVIKTLLCDKLLITVLVNIAMFRVYWRLM